VHRKDIKRLKLKAATEWKDGNREEANRLWQQADKERKALQAKKRENKSKKE
jgi:hypothetical protein